MVVGGEPLPEQADSAKMATTTINSGMNRRTLNARDIRLQLKEEGQASTDLEQAP